MDRNASYYVVVLGNNGKLEEHRMNDWCRKHPEHTPHLEFKKGTTTEQVMVNLLKQNWVAHGTPEKIRLVSPDAIGTRVLEVLFEIETG